jgi:hypothetical protein
MAYPGRVLVALALAALALQVSPVTVNADDDPAPERLLPVAVEDGERQLAALEDECDGAPRTFRLTPPRETVVDLVGRDLDGNPAGVPPRIELYAEGRSGASGRHGIARILRYDTTCARPRILFSYSSTAPKPRAPRGYEVGAFSVLLKNYERRRAGIELRLQETLLRPGQPLIAARRERVSYWRFDRRAGRYRSYRTTVRDLR